MIDTDDYKKHTPAPWTIDVHKVGEDTSAIVIESNMTTHSNCVLAEVEVENKYAEADAQLIADAPLLLQALIDERAEVKRMADKLRAEEDTHDLIEGKLREQVDELKEEVKRLYDKNRFYALIIYKMQGGTVYDNAIYETLEHFNLSNECLDDCLICMEMIE